MPSDRPIRSGNDQRTSCLTFHQLLEGGYGKIRGSEEDDLHRRSVHDVSVSSRLRLGCSMHDASMLGVLEQENSDPFIGRGVGEHEVSVRIRDPTARRRVDRIENRASVGRWK